MNFSSTHVETLCDLQALAKKHNHRISFSCDYSHSDELNTELLLKNNIPEHMIEILEDEDCVENIETISQSSRLWFALMDNKSDTTHTMEYRQETMYFVFRILDPEEYSMESFTDYCYQTFEEGFDDTFYDGFTHYPTIIQGFGNKEKIIDNRVYREGMALKFFGDLVCDYLGEPRIKRVY